MRYLGPEPCRHAQFEPRLRTLSNNTVHVWNQCLSCGAPVGSARPKAKYDLPKLEPFNEEAVGRLKAEERGSPPPWNDDFWRWYTLYLESPTWAEKRGAVLARDRERCQACLVERATQAHHLTYRHIGREPLFELTAVCEPCHTLITAMDRGQNRDDTLPW
jgi:hypothetical protein